jgi:uncharacterized membrane protein
MMEYGSVLKWVHILSSTVLFGTGIGTAFFMWSAHLSNNVEAIAHVSKTVVRADWIFTLVSGIVQPVSGAMLALNSGYSLSEPWLTKTYALYGIALICWLPVVWLQMRMRDMAQTALSSNTPLPRRYYRYARIWFALGWPAFLALMAVFYLMVAKPG